MFHGDNHKEIEGQIELAFWLAATVLTAAVGYGTIALVCYLDFRVLLDL